MENVSEVIEQLDRQIEDYKGLLKVISDSEPELREDWSVAGLESEDQLIDKISELQDKKTKVIIGEKFIEKVTVDKVREVKVVEYVDRVVKTININKSSVSTILLTLVLILNMSIILAYYVGLFYVVINKNFNPDWFLP